MKQFILLLTLALSAGLQAQPTKLIESVLFQLNLRIEDCYEPLITEKQMPDSPKESIVVIPKIAEIGDGYFSLDTYIVVVNNVSGNIKSKYYESAATNGWQSDAISLDEITIDTAPYKVKEKTRAFGIRVRFSGHHSVLYQSEMLSLFVQQGDKLNVILKNFEVDKYNGELNNIECNGYYKDIHKILLMSANKTGDYFDILVKTKIINTAVKPNAKDGEECDEVETEENKEEILKFKNGKYISLPKK